MLSKLLGSIVEDFSSKNTIYILDLASNQIAPEDVLGERKSLLLRKANSILEKGLPESEVLEIKRKILAIEDQVNLCLNERDMDKVRQEALKDLKQSVFYLCGHGMKEPINRLGLQAANWLARGITNLKYLRSFEIWEPGIEKIAIRIAPKFKRCFGLEIEDPYFLDKAFSGDFFEKFTKNNSK